jgi:hypothetical protein
VLITQDDWAREAQRAGLDRSVLLKVQTRWTQDGDDRPAFLTSLGENRYFLADREPYQAARQWLMESARRSKIRSSKAKARSAHKSQRGRR